MTRGGERDGIYFQLNHWVPRPSAEKRRAAMLACAANATDADDLRMLLAMLGLIK